jgi:outer membrane protein assembly factor BamB
VKNGPLQSVILESGNMNAADGLPSVNWWMYHHDVQHTGLVVGSHINRTNVPFLRLRRWIPLAGPVVSVPAVVDNKVYVGVGNSTLAAYSSGGTLYKIGMLTGIVEGAYTFNTPPFRRSRQGLAGIACAPTVIDNCVYFSGLDGKLYCLDSDTLIPVWITDLRHADRAHNQPVTHAVNAEGWGSPLVINGRVYVGFGESESNAFGFIYCLDAATGTVIWLFCTTVFPGMSDNDPNVIPESAVGLSVLPPGFTVAADPPSRGASPWSSCAYDVVSNRIIVGTGNVLPQHPLPQPRYSLGVISLDATTGGEPRFFQPSNSDNYRPDDTDVDVPAGPTIFLRGAQRVVAIGSKNGSFFLLDANTLEVLPNGRRQLLPRAGGNGGFPGDTGLRLPGVDPHPPDPTESTGRLTENFYGIFGSAAVHYGMRRLFVGVGGFAFGVGTPGIDYRTTPFLRALNWSDLTDAWWTAVGPDQVRRYVLPSPPMYTTPGEAGFSSPVVVNDVVMVSTSKPALYAFDAATGQCLWSAPGFGAPAPNSFTLGPAIYGDYVVVGSANIGLLIYSL